MSLRACVDQFERAFQVAICMVGGAVVFVMEFGYTAQGKFHAAIFGAFCGLVVLGIIRLVGHVAGHFWESRRR